MTKGMKFAVLAGAVIIVAMIAAAVFVSPKKALSSAIMRDCIEVVERKVRGAGAVSIISVAAIQPDPNKRKIEEFGSATQALIRRGDLVPSEPEVLVEFETNRGTGNALCMYHADLQTNSGTYASVSLQEAQVGLQSLSSVEIVMDEPFRVGYLDRVIALVPIIGTKQKFFLD